MDPLQNYMKLSGPLYKRRVCTGLQFGFLCVIVGISILRKKPCTTPWWSGVLICDDVFSIPHLYDEHISSEALICNLVVLQGGIGQWLLSPSNTVSTFLNLICILVLDTQLTI